MASPASTTSGYILKRKLAPPFVGPILLSGFVVGTVISGEFFGWTAGLLYGWKNMVVATILAALMYLGLACSVCELCCALPFASGPAVFAQAAFNSGMGALAGGVAMTQYIVQAAALLVALTEFVQVALLGGPKTTDKQWGIWILWQLFCWGLPTVLTALVHIRPHMFFRLCLVLTLYSLLLIGIYVILTFSSLHQSTTKNTIPGIPGKELDMSARPFLSSYACPYQVGIQMAPNIPIMEVEDDEPEEGTQPLSWHRIVICFPFACWLFCGVEAFPATSEEARRITKTAPKATLYASCAVLLLAIALISVVPDDGLKSQFALSDHALLDDTLRILCMHPRSHLVTTPGNVTIIPASNITTKYSPTGKGKQNALEALSLSNSTSSNFTGSLAFEIPEPLPKFSADACVLTCEDRMGRFQVSDGSPNLKNSLVRTLVAVCLLPPLFLGLSCSVYTAARQAYTLSRGGVLPKWLSLTLRPHGAPLYATWTTIFSALVVGVLTKVASFTMSWDELVVDTRAVGNVSSDSRKPPGKKGVEDADPKWTVFHATMKLSALLACFGYVLVCSAYVIVRWRIPTLPRPFISILGIPGALLTLLTAATMGIVAPLFNAPRLYIPVVAALLVLLFLVAVPYYYFIARSRMLDSPEKIFVRQQIQNLYGHGQGRPSPSAPSTTCPLPSNGLYDVPVSSSVGATRLSGRPDDKSNRWGHEGSSTSGVQSGAAAMLAIARGFEEPPPSGRERTTRGGFSQERPARIFTPVLGRLRGLNALHSHTRQPSNAPALPSSNLTSEASVLNLESKGTGVDGWESREEDVGEDRVIQAQESTGSVECPPTTCPSKAFKASSTAPARPSTQASPICGSFPKSLLPHPPPALAQRFACAGDASGQHRSAVTFNMGDDGAELDSYMGGGRNERWRLRAGAWRREIDQVLGELDGCPAHELLPRAQRVSDLSTPGYRGRKPEAEREAGIRTVPLGPLVCERSTAEPNVILAVDNISANPTNGTPTSPVRAIQFAASPPEDDVIATAQENVWCAPRGDIPPVPPLPPWLPQCSTTVRRKGMGDHPEGCDP